MSRGPARGPLGWAWALSPRVGSRGFPGLLVPPWILGLLVRTMNSIGRADKCVKSKCAAFGGNIPPAPKRILIPLVPLSPSRDSGQALRANKGKGEGITEGSACARAQALPSSLVLEGEKDRKNGRNGYLAPTPTSSLVLGGGAPPQIPRGASE